MEYGLDKKGQLLKASFANSWDTYRCPICFEELTLNKGRKQVTYFSHSIIKNRTPLQRICPDYKENKDYSKIDNKKDILYIENGGLPLHLVKVDGQYELRAYFPRLIDKGKYGGLSIELNSKAKPKYRKTYSLDKLDYYKLDNLNKWIDVELSNSEKKSVDKTLYDEIKTKWLWGVRGVDISSDIFYEEKDGGYRLALRSNISLDKNYLMIVKSMEEVNKYKEIEGMDFKEDGLIYLNDLRFNSRKKYIVVKFRVSNICEESRKFVESRGYRLVDESLELYPIWPAFFKKGKQIIIDDNSLFFYKTKNPSKSKEKIQKNRLELKNTFKNYYKLSIYSNCDLIKNFNNHSDFNSKEILYNIYKTNIPKIENKKEKFNIFYQGEKLNFTKIISQAYFNKNLEVKSPYPLDIYVREEGMVVYSSKTRIKELDYGRELEIVVNKRDSYLYYCDLEEKDNFSDIYENKVDLKDIERKLNINSRKRIRAPRYRYLGEELDSIKYSKLKQEIINKGIPIEFKNYFDSLWRDSRE